MMSSLFRFVILLASLFPLGLAAQDGIPAKPVPAEFYVNLSTEFPDFISKKQAIALEKNLRNFATETSTQIAVVVLDDLKGYDSGEFATKLLNNWGIGDREKNNGLVILIKPTGGPGERKTFIAVGYGLEDVIPDATARQVVDRMILKFKSGDFYGGIDGAVEELKLLAENKYPAVNKEK